VGGQISAYSGCAACLAALQKEAPPLNIKAILSAIQDHLHARVNEAVAELGFALGEPADSNVQAFAPEKFNVTVLSFDLTFHITDISQSGERASAKVHVLGDCSARTDSLDIQDMRVRWVSLEWANREGKPVIGSIDVWTIPPPTISIPSIPYKLRYPVN